MPVWYGIDKSMALDENAGGGENYCIEIEFIPEG
jgi:hypothetical protein